MKLQEESAALPCFHLTQRLHQLGTGWLVVAFTFIKKKNEDLLQPTDWLLKEHTEDKVQRSTLSEGGRNGHGLLTAAFNLTTWLDPLQ